MNWYKTNKNMFHMYTRESIQLLIILCTTNGNKEMLRLHDTGDIIYTNDNLILILLCNEEIRLNQFVIRT